MKRPNFKDQLSINLNRYNSKIIIVVLSTLFFAANICAKTIDFVALSHSSKMFGESIDGRYLAALENRSNDQNSIYRIDTTNSSEISIFIDHSVNGGDISSDGRYIAWSESEVNEDDISTYKLKYYDFETRNAVEIEVGEISPGVRISAPKFIRNSNKIIYLIGDIDSVFYRNHRNIVIQDILTGDKNVISPFPNDTEVSYYNIESIRISGNGQVIAYHRQEIFPPDETGGVFPTVITSIDKFIYHDLESNLSMEINDGVSTNSYVKNYKLTYDGKILAYNFFFDEIKMFNASENSYQTIDLSAYSEQILTLFGLSDDGNTLLFGGSSPLPRHMEITQNQQFNISESTSSHYYSIRVLNLTNNKSEVVNMINSYQFISPYTVMLSADGTRVRMTAPNLNPTGGFVDRLSYISHTIDYDFKADYGVSGMWYETETPGQGIVINFATTINHPNGIATVTWYTVDNEGKPLWLLMNSAFTVGGNRLTGQAIQVTGTQFGPNFNSSDTEVITWGTLTLEFHDCQNATLNYVPEMSGFPSGEMQLSRLTYQTGLGCI